MIGVVILTMGLELKFRDELRVIPVLCATIVELGHEQDGCERVSLLEMLNNGVSV